VLVTNDVLDIEIEVSNSNEDDDLGVTKNINLDSSELPPADPEVSTINDTNLATGIYYYELPQSAWRNYLAQLKATCSTTSSQIDVYATLDPAAAVPATNGTPSVDWNLITPVLYGVSPLLVPTTGTLVPPIKNWGVDDNQMMAMYDRFLLKYNVLNAANFINLNVRKF
jgi:hypothetical protein